MNERRHEQAGQAVIEYAFVLALVALIVALALLLTGGGVLMACSNLIGATPCVNPTPGAEAFWTGGTVAAFVAAGVALVVAIISAIIQWRLASRVERFTLQQQEHDWRVRQLNELYGPLRMYRETSKRLRESLPRYETDGRTRWPLVAHLPEAKSDPGQKLIVDEILAINRAIESLLLHKAGLMEPPDPTPNFSRFMQHSRLLRLAWRRGDVLGTAPQVDVTDVPFPQEIDTDITDSINRIRAALDSESKPAEQTGQMPARG